MAFDNPDDLFYLVDENDEVVGSIARADAHSDQTKIHRSICVIVTNQHEQMLLQQRSLHKDLYPGQWSLACFAHVIYGQTYLQTAEREIFAEIGIHPHLFFVTKLLVKTESETEQCSIYICKITETPDHYDKEAVMQVMWVDFKDLALFGSKNPLPQKDMNILQCLQYL